jgi:succinoglycan biosynthesis transport protein ExoP
MVYGAGMLQRSKTQSGISRPSIGPQEQSEGDSLQAFTSFVRRQFPVIVFVTILAMSLGVIYVITARPRFTAEALLLVDAQKMQVFQQQPIVGDLPVDTAEVESEVEILKSENIASAVIKNLHLTENPDFMGSSNGLLGALFSFVVRPFGNDAENSEFEISRNAIRAFQDGLTVKRVGLTYVIQIDFKSYNADLAAQIANAIADAYVDDQLGAKYQATKRASVWLQDRIKELRDQVSAAEQAVVEFTTKNNIVSTGGSDNRPLAEAQVTELSSQLVIARANTAEAKARLDRINSILKGDITDSSFGATVADTLKSDVVSKLRSQYLELAAREADWSAKYGYDHIAVVNLRNQMLEINNAILDELKRLGETYKSDFEIAKQREVGVQQELAQAVAQSQVVDAKSVSLRELQSTAQTYKTLYDNFLQRYMDSVQQQSFPISEARLISSASRPLHKSDPKTALVMALAGLGGIVIGFGIGMLRDLSDRVFRTSEQVERILQADCIAVIPLLTDEASSDGPSDLGNQADSNKLTNLTRPDDEHYNMASRLLSRSFAAVRSSAMVSDLHGTIKSTKGRISAFKSSLSERDNQPTGPEPSLRGATSASGRKTIVWDDSFRVVVDRPFSRFTEAIRSIKLAYDLNGAVKANRVLGLTSSLPNEGKSTVAVSVARLMSQVGGRTILIDCDLRNPSLSRSLAPGATNGLLHVIAEKASLEETIWKDPSTNMSFLPAVMTVRLAHSNEILNSAPVKKLFERLREDYDCIVVDLPPLAPVVDVLTTTDLVDSYIFVVEWGRTKIDVVEHALGHAPGIYDSLLGVVLNKVDMNVFGRYASHHESYYNKHYARYGYTE